MPEICFFTYLQGLVAPVSLGASWASVFPTNSWLGANNGGNTDTFASTARHARRAVPIGLEKTDDPACRGIRNHRNGLAKVCERLDVPYPPRGYWAKKEAGKPVVTLKLLPRRDGIPSAADIHPTPPKPAPSPTAEQAAATVADRIRDVVVPESNDNLHPRVQAWIAGHNKRQKEREQENRSPRRDIGWVSPSIPDLTERDLYRFRATSAIFYAAEKVGGTIEKSSASGKVTFLIDGHQVGCSIVEEMVQSLKQWEECFAQDNDVVQTLTPDRPDQPFDKAVLPG
jgi:hypothetical protein